MKLISQISLELAEFKRIVSTFMNVVDKVSAEVDKEKMKVTFEQVIIILFKLSIRFFIYSKFIEYFITQC